MTLSMTIGETRRYLDAAAELVAEHDTALYA